MRAGREGPLPEHDAGRDEVLRCVAEEAEHEALATLAAADEEAGRLVAAARAELALRVEAALARADEEAGDEAGRRLNEARLRLVHRRAALTRVCLDSVFDAAASRLEAIASGPGRDRWTDALRRLAAEGCERAGPRPGVDVRQCDAPVLGSAALDGWRVAGGLPEPGIRIRSADGRVEIDGRVSVRLARAREVLSDRVALDLGLGESAGDR